MFSPYHVGLFVNMDARFAWQEALERSSLSGRDFLARVGEAGVLFSGEPLCVHRQPLFLAEEHVRAFARILASFHSAVRKAKALLIADGMGVDSLAHRIGLSAQERELVAIDPGYASAATIARVDSFCPGGHPWLLELNAESPTGMGYSDALTELLREDPIYAQVGPFEAFRAADAALRALHATYREWGGTGSPQLAIVDFADVPTRSDFHLLVQAFERHGVDCALVDPRDLRFESGVLQGPKGRIDLVYRRVLVDDLIARSGECAALVAAYRQQAVCVVNSLRTPLLHSKGLFALLHSTALSAHLTSAERAVVERHVPKTLMCSTDFGDSNAAEQLDEVAANPNDWVLKPVSQSGGKGVRFGSQMDPQDWASLVRSAKDCVVQRAVQPWIQEFPDARVEYARRKCLVDLDPFLIQGRLAGFMCRLSDGAPVNVAQGAHSVPVFVTSEEVE